MTKNPALTPITAPDPTDHGHDNPDDVPGCTVCQRMLESFLGHQHRGTRLETPADWELVIGR